MQKAWFSQFVLHPLSMDGHLTIDFDQLVTYALGGRSRLPGYE